MKEEVIPKNINFDSNVLNLLKILRRSVHN